MEKKIVKMHPFLSRCINDFMHNLTCAIMFVSRLDAKQRECLEAIYAKVLEFLDTYYPLPNQSNAKSKVDNNEKDS